MNTKLTKLLGIEYPILQGGMAWISESRLAAAVSNAGGAGIISSGGRELEWIRSEIRRAKELTDKPFGVNVVMQDPTKEEIIDLICHEKVSFVTMGAGNPVPFIPTLHHAGIHVIPVIPNVRLAKRVEDAGADAIVVEGMEAAGHIGTLTTMALLTNVVPEVMLPVIAAGGIVDGRGLAAALVMGASGIQMGTRFILTEECVAHTRMKESIIAAIDTDSVVTGTISGMGAVRGLKNRFAEHFLELERSGASEDILSNFGAGALKLCAVGGDVENGSIQVGQSLCPLKKIQTAAEVIQEVTSETIRLLMTAPTLV